MIDTIATAATMLKSCAPSVTTVAIDVSVFWICATADHVPPARPTMPLRMYAVHHNGNVLGTDPCRHTIESPLPTALGSLASQTSFSA